jgi:ribonucleoside-triphosphate reductase
MIRKIANNFRLPYFTLTPTFSVCPSHGYLNGKQETCTVCKQETEVYSRVVGYLRPVKQWNEGKRAEFGIRKTFNLDSTVADAGESAQPDSISNRRDKQKSVVPQPLVFEKRPAGLDA